MGGRWKTQSDRWRLAMGRSAEGSEADRLAAAIAEEIRKGVMPPGALLPTEARLAVDMMVDESVVSGAYEHLERAGLLRSSSDRRIYVAGALSDKGGTGGRGATILAFPQGRRPVERPGDND